MRFASGHVKASLTALKGAKMRNFWTMLGIIIGVASVITVVSIGEGIKQQISQQFHHYGKDLIIVQPSAIGTGGTSVTKRGALAGIQVSSFLSSKDAATVANTKGVAISAPLSVVTGPIHGDNGAYKDGVVIGTSPDLPSLLNQSLAYGFFLTSNDNESNVAILGAHAADALFNENVPLGRTLTFRGKEFIVRGIFNSFDTTPLSVGADYNNAIFIPYDVSQSMTNGTAPTFQILAKPDTAKQLEATRQNVQRNLDISHGGTSNITVVTSNQNVGDDNAVLDLMTRLIAGVAAISLLVGGVGIMNVMLVSVAERMHEIGIRKAIGATNRQILTQFLTEATLLSLIGGLIGVLVAGFIDISLRVATNLQPVISWHIIVIAVGVSLVVGVIFGTLPALKAARKDPIEALRSA